jgi:hypothetical protein
MCLQYVPASSALDGYSASAPCRVFIFSKCRRPAPVLVRHRLRIEWRRRHWSMIEHTGILLLNRKFVPSNRKATVSTQGVGKVIERYVLSLSNNGAFLKGTDSMRIFPRCKTVTRHLETQRSPAGLNARPGRSCPPPLENGGSLDISSRVCSTPCFQILG